MFPQSFITQFPHNYYRGSNHDENRDQFHQDLADGHSIPIVVHKKYRMDF
jgi:hypothetical protein